MALRGPRPALLLTLTLLAACVALTIGHRWNPLNDIFRRKHVDFLKTSATSDNTYCNKMMWDRVMYLKRTNTFIHSSNKDLNKVCTTDGVASGPYNYKSTNAFKITICTLRPWSIFYTGVSASKKIIVSCWDGLPVFYVKHI